METIEFYRKLLDWNKKKIRLKLLIYLDQSFRNKYYHSYVQVP